jgi:predicted nucleic acid-binding Zn ribbon protein
MPKKILYSNFEDIGSIVKVMLEDKEIKKAVTRNNLYLFWKKIVGEKLAESSKPYGMTSNYTMIIACKSSVVAQELTMQKQQILENLEPYAKSLKIKVKDFKFDTKKWEG